MDDGQEQEHYEERLKEVFSNFDTSGCGSLSSSELSDLCLSLHLDDATPALLHTLLQNHDHLTARVDFDQFKNALILLLSSTAEPSRAEAEAAPRPESPEIQPKFVKGGKRYGRRSTPEFKEPDLAEAPDVNPAGGEDLEDNYDSAVPRKRERWNAHDTSSEEYEAEGQMHLWNPDEPSTPRGSMASLSARLEERLRGACDELAIAWDGCADYNELLALCEHLDLELNGDVLLGLPADGLMSVQEFVSRILNHNKPPTPSASTPYRQLKRHHSTQPFDEGGRRISALPSSIGMRLFSTLDNGTGFTPTESILDVWIEEGIENSAEILQALNFELDGKLSLYDLTTALENELLVTKNGIHQAALASFKAEIRYLLERVDQEIREKEKLQSDLERAEKQKSQLAAEVDEHHSAIENMNNLNLRKLEQDYKEKLAAVRSELVKEMEQLQQQAGLQREQLRAEVEKIREDESFLRDHLSVSVKENRRLEVELLDSTEKLAEARSQITKLQTNLENIMKDKFGDLDPGTADFLLQEERVKQLRASYEAQCRELQDRIDELQAELQGFRTLGRAHELCGKPLADELESKSPGTESDPGIGSEEVQPFSMSLEAEMMLEQLKEQHLHEMKDLRDQLESKINEFDKIVEKQGVAHEDQKAALMFQHQQEVQALKERAASVQSLLQQAEAERTRLEQNRTAEREELENQRDEEVGNLRQQLLEAHVHAADLEEQLNALEERRAETEERMEELRSQHAAEVRKLKEEQAELLEARLTEGRSELLELKTDLEREKKVLEERSESTLKAQLEEAARKFEEERDEMVRELSERWQEDRARLEARNDESLRELLEEEMLRLVREQEEKEEQLREHWESERARLQERHQVVLLDRLAQERLRLQEELELREDGLKEEWERERLRLEEDYEGMIRDRLSEERDKLGAEERAHLEEKHGEAVKELMEKHAEERNALGAMLDDLRHDIAQERKEVEICFSQRIQEVEARFSHDQELVAKRFQADVAKIEEDYRSERAALSESLAAQKLRWEAELREALRAAEEQRTAAESLERERDRLGREWEMERLELENVHSEDMEALKTENERLQQELVGMMSEAQGKEIKLSMQLNDLHRRLREEHELLAQSESRAQRLELLLDRTAEQAELLAGCSELGAKRNKTLSPFDRIHLLTERGGSKAKPEEPESLLKRAAADFELRGNGPAFEETPGVDEGEPRGEREELKMELEQFLVFVEKEAKEPNDIKRKPNRKKCRSSSGEETPRASDEQDDLMTCAEDKIKADQDSEEDGSAANQNEGVWVRAEDAASQEWDEPAEGAAAFDLARLGSSRVFGEGRDHGSRSLEGPSPERGERSLEVLEPRREEIRPRADREEAAGEPAEHSEADDSDNGQEAGLVCEHENRYDRAQDCVETPDGDSDCENQESFILSLQSLCATATEENVLLHNKVSLLQQKAELLENLLALHSEKLQTSRRALEESHALKVQSLVLMRHVNELERNTLKLADLQRGYKGRVRENAKLRERNGELERRAFALFRGFQDRRVSLAGELSGTRAENARLFELLGELSAGEAASPPPGSRLQAERCCKEFEERNTKLRRAIAELRDKSEALNKTTQAHRSAASCLAEENALLRESIAALKDGDLKKSQDELTQALEDLKNEKSVAQQAADRFQKQISELSLQSRNLEDENGSLTERSALSAASMESLRRQLLGLMEETERREAIHAEEKNKMAACVSALEAELTKALEDAAQLEERNIQLSERLSDLREKTFQLDSVESQLSHLEEERKTVEEETAGLRSQLAKAQEKMKTADESLQVVHRQASRLKSDLQVLQQERDSLKHDVSVLHKQLQNSNDRNHVLEMALHSSGLQNHSKKLYREEMSRLMGQEQQLLRQENSRLQSEVHSIKTNLIQSREKVRQLDATILLLNKHKQQSQSSLVKALEQENASLKQELEAKRQPTKGCEAELNQADLEDLQQENEALKAQIARLSSQVLESFQAQFVGLLPPSPLRAQRGPHRAEEPDNMQGERERKMGNMEERMREIELSLRNVKLLLKEKVTQLKDQLHKNGKADVLIKDLYTENTQLLKALEITEQRQKIAEKKNYLLEEKISSLNKIVRDLNPSTLPGLSFNYKYQ
ncbi:ninein isoform X2 [Kryptolebias marmoratus]|nr:ninein isoform X2 [Kryptolebias marmoratus]